MYLLFITLFNYYLFFYFYSAFLLYSWSIIFWNGSNPYFYNLFSYLSYSLNWTNGFYCGFISERDLNVAVRNFLCFILSFKRYSWEFIILFILFEMFCYLLSYCAIIFFKLYGPCSSATYAIRIYSYRRFYCNYNWFIYCFVYFFLTGVIYLDLGSYFCFTYLVVT